MSNWRQPNACGPPADNKLNPIECQCVPTEANWYYTRIYNIRVTVTTDEVKQRYFGKLAPSWKEMVRGAANYKDTERRKGYHEQIETNQVVK